MLIDKSILNTLIQEAKQSTRLRKNYNLHESLGDSVQRMFNAIEPDSIIPIARHPNASETIIIIRGSLKITIYSDNKEVIEEVVLSHGSGNVCYHILKGVWHKAEALETGTIIFETKEGPYEPLKDIDIIK